MENEPGIPQDFTQDIPAEKPLPPRIFGDMDAKATRRVLLAGLIIGAVMVIPYHAWLWDEDWQWAYGFPLGWLGIGLTYMSTFFHEIGHTLAAWFYGYFTLPSFDFAHGGGMAWSFGGQQIGILLLLYGAIGYGLYMFRGLRALQVALAAALLFNLATAFNEDIYRSVIDFMGPAFVPLIAAFLLYRTIMDLAPRGGFERLLNAVFGFGLIFHALTEAYNLLNNEAYRLVYFEQKGQHGFGDFDKIAGRFASLDFHHVVMGWAGLCLVCLILPFLLARMISRA